MEYLPCFIIAGVTLSVGLFFRRERQIADLMERAANKPPEPRLFTRPRKRADYQPEVKQRG